MSKSAVVLLSGGIDSTVALALAMKECSFVHPLSIRYGAKHMEREDSAAEQVCRHYGLSRRVFELPPYTFKDGQSALMGQADMPKGEYHTTSAEGPNATEVPFRNANLISIATSRALILKCDYVYIGVHATDAHAWAYPDCSPEFIGAMANAVYVGTMQRVRLVAPLTNLDKAGVVNLGAALRAPLHLTWSCYEGGVLPCGVCPTCVERLRAFAYSGFRDPLWEMYPKEPGFYERWASQYQTPFPAPDQHTTRSTNGLPDF